MRKAIVNRGCSSNGRAIASHAIGNGIDARHLHFFSYAWNMSACVMHMELFMYVRRCYYATYYTHWSDTERRPAWINNYMSSFIRYWWMCVCIMYPCVNNHRLVDMDTCLSFWCNHTLVSALICAPTYYTRTLQFWDKLGISKPPFLDIWINWSYVSLLACITDLDGETEDY